MKKILTAGLSLILTISAITPVLGATPLAENTADILHSKGIFNGTGSDENGNPVYDLDSPAKRQQAVTLLVTLMGKGDEAKNTAVSIPFTDVDDWAAPYVSYAYNNGIVYGESSTYFAADNDITLNQYLTMVLGALGYKAGVDFTWNQAVYKALDIGLLYELKEESTFTRGDIAVISHKALFTRPKGSQITLGESLGLNLDKDIPSGLGELTAIIKNRYGFDVTFEKVLTDEATNVFALKSFYEYCLTVPDEILRDLAKSRKNLVFTGGGEYSYGKNIIKLPVYTTRIQYNSEREKTVNGIIEGISDIIGRYITEKYWRNIPDGITEKEFKRLVGEFLLRYDIKYESDGTVTVSQSYARRALQNYDTGSYSIGIVKIKDKLNSTFETLCKLYNLGDVEADSIDPNGCRVKA